ncbi:MAG: anion transporter [Anaerolineae bacterium]|nr:anion transporter [Anaerolineae bacterium]
MPPPALTLLIVIITYAGIALGTFPRTRMNRATIAVVGAAALVLVGALTEEQALHALDMGTILLLGAMMVINVNLRLAGFFRVVTGRTLRLARTPAALLALVILSAGVLSALFLNDTICLMLTPIVIEMALRLGRHPLPYLIGLAVATNVGSVATITGNPQNIIIGQSSGIPYLTFLAALGPVALAGLAVCWLVIMLVYRDALRGTLPVVALPPPRPYRPLLTRTLLLVAGLLLAFLAGAPIVTAACVAAGALLISRVRPARLLALDWELLVLFAGLFVVTGAIEQSGLSEALFAQFRGFLQGGMVPLTAVTAILSNVVSNVPAVLLFRPEMANFPDADRAWLTLAMASTLAGNLTLLGSAATLIVAELARPRGVELGFVAFLKVGVPVTLLTLLIGVVWLSVLP